MPGSEPGLHPWGCPRWRRLFDEWKRAQTPLCALTKKRFHSGLPPLSAESLSHAREPMFQICGLLISHKVHAQESRDSLDRPFTLHHSTALIDHAASARWSCTVRVGTRVRVNNSLQCSLASQQRSPTRSCVMHVAPFCSPVRTTADHRSWTLLCPPTFGTSGPLLCGMWLFTLNVEFFPYRVG